MALDCRGGDDDYLAVMLQDLYVDGYSLPLAASFFIAVIAAVLLARRGLDKKQARKRGWATAIAAAPLQLVLFAVDPTNDWNVSAFYLGGTPVACAAAGFWAWFFIIVHAG